MEHALAVLIAGLLFLGHSSIWVAAFNRINATGLQRKTIKKIEKIFVLAWGLLPVAIYLWDAAAWYEWMGHPWSGHFSLITLLYLGCCGAALLGFAPSWLLSRWELREDAHPNVHIVKQQWHVDQMLPHATFASTWTSRLGRVPGNQIGMLERSHKCIPAYSAPSWEGVRFAHLSDLHLTGRMGLGFYQFAIEQLNELQPDAIFLTGDLVDYDSQLPALQSLAVRMRAPLGMYFVLGNHDRRIAEPDLIREIMTSEGWMDVGSTAVTRHTDRGCLAIAGNERPWFGTPVENWPTDARGTNTLRVALSHSPDQWRWGVSLKSHLILAGHTHGGQVRLPGIGPMIAPSWNGSRFASGIFHLEETWMHVSRGLSGVHPIRYRCMPEVTILELSSRPIRDLPR